MYYTGNRKNRSRRDDKVLITGIILFFGLAAFLAVLILAGYLS